MATKSIKYPLTQAVKRGFAAQAAVKPAETFAAPEIEGSVLPNKLMVSCLDRNGPLSRVSVVFRVGPRNETNENKGATHVIRSMTGFSSTKCSGFAIVRNLQQQGIHLTCTGDREITAFHVVSARNKIKDAFKYLSATASAPAFKPWQIKDNFPRIKYEIGCLSPEARTMDILHKAAYRTGLGNSLFIKKDQIGTHTSEMLNTFFKEGFTANRAAVAGINVCQGDLIEFAKSLELDTNEPVVGNSTYYGGEIRKDKKSYYAHVAIAAEGVGLKDVKEALTYSILQHAYGVRPSIVWGSSPSPLYRAVTTAAPDAGVSCFNFSYSDSGLFGFVITAPGKSAGTAVKEAFKVMKSASVTGEDVKRAKALLKMNILSSCENSEVLNEDMGVQSLYGGVIIPGPVLVEAIDKVTESDVTTAAKKIAGAKLSMAGFGNLNEVPFLDQLK